jgi:hypothetical protein
MIRLKNGDQHWFQFITQLNKLTVIKENANRLYFFITQRIPSEIKYYGSTCPHSHTKKMDTLFLGILFIPCCVLWFLAENFREHQVENKEKQYMQSLLSDLSSSALRLLFP